MSKRGAQVQGSKDGGFLGDGSERVNMDDVPKRATAAQLANRKLKSIKGRKGPSGSQPQTPQQLFPQQPFAQQNNLFGQQQQKTTSFGFTPQQPVDPQLSNPFGFQQPQPPQQQSAGIFGATNNSFPTPQPSTPSTLFANSSFPTFGGNTANPQSFSFKPPSSDFNFSGGFSTGGNNPFTMSNAGSAVNGTATTGFTGLNITATSQPTQPLQGLFSLSDFSSGGNNPFATSNAGSTVNNTATTGFSGITITATSKPTQPSLGAFSSWAPPVTHTTQPAVTTPQNTAGGYSFLGQNNPTTPFPSGPVKTFISPPDDAMQTSPDNSPGKPSENTASAAQPVAPQSGGLFSMPSASSRPQFPDFQQRTTTVQPSAQSSGGSLFSRITPADPKPQVSSPQETAVGNAETPQPPKSIFQFPSINQPSAKLEPKNIFGGSVPPTSTMTNGQPASTQAGNKPANTFPFKSTTTQPSPYGKPADQDAQTLQPTTSFATQSNGLTASQAQPDAFTAGTRPDSSTASVGTQSPQANVFAPLKPSTGSSLSTNNDLISTGRSSSSTPSISNVFTQEASSTSAAPAVQPVGTGFGSTAMTSVAQSSNSAPNLGTTSPDNLSGFDKKIFIETERLHALNTATRDVLLNTPPTVDCCNIHLWHVKKYRKIKSGLDALKREKEKANGGIAGLSTGPNKRKADEESVTENGSAITPAKKAKGNQQGSQTSMVFGAVIGSPANQTSPVQPMAPSNAANQPSSAFTKAFTPFRNTTTTSTSSSGSQDQPSQPNPSTTNIASFSTSGPDIGLAKSTHGSSSIPAPGLSEFTPSVFPKESAASKTTAPPASKLTATSQAYSSTLTTDTQSNQTSSTAAVFKIPGVDLTASKPNYFGQFAEKAGDFDPEEETLNDWEARNKAERAKQAEDAKKAPSFQFIPTSKSSVGSVFSFAKISMGSTKTSNGSSNDGLFVSRTGSPTPSTTGGASVFDTPPQKSSASVNIFGHLSETESGADRKDDQDENSDVSDEDQVDQNGGKDLAATTGSPVKSGKRTQSESGTEDETLEEVMRKKRQDRSAEIEKQASDSGIVTPSKGPSIFDRIKMGADGKPERELASSTEQSNGISETPPRKATLFGQSLPSSKNLFQPNTTLFGGQTAGDQTFKHDSPIKFGASTTTAPSFNVTPASPSPGAGDLKPTSNLFGGLNASSGPSIFANTNSPSDKSASVGWSFGGAPATNGPPFSFLNASGTSSAVPSGLNSPLTSRATTPFSADETSGKESATDKDDNTSNDTQLLLTDLTEEEKRDEDVLFDCKGRANLLDKETKNWVIQGTGPVRILKNKSTRVVRVVMRKAPGGSIVLNTRLVPKLLATATKKAVTFTVAVDGAFNKWHLQFGKAESAEEFAKAYNDNRPE